jgi:NDP-sugar pyrophosphorylase family protein
MTLNLVVLAAGMGSRFGGLKQVAAVDAAGHALIDYAVYDALRAGFGRVVIVVTPALEPEFHERIGRRLARRAEVVYAHQSLDAVPAGFAVPPERTKPWGTAHAVLCAAEQITGPFATINADDFYGADAYAAVAGFLAREARPERHALAGYELKNTLSECGEVSRGVCQTDSAGRLTAITEHTRVGWGRDGQILSTTADGVIPLDPAAPVSLNLWAFHPAVLDEFRDRFPEFLRQALPANPLKAEFFLPDIPGGLVRSGRAEVQVLATPDRWYGVTYADDLPQVKAAIAARRAGGAYPDHLWED